jgi:hypothetical protein
MYGIPDRRSCESLSLSLVKGCPADIGFCEVDQHSQTSLMLGQTHGYTKPRYHGRPLLKYIPQWTEGTLSISSRE